MLARIEGQITAIDFFQPTGDQKKKPHHLITVMQSTGKESEVIKVKDFNLQARYDMFQNFSNLCTIRDWAFNGRSGLSVTVSGGSLLLSPGGSPGLGDDMPIDLVDEFEPLPKGKK